MEHVLREFIVEKPIILCNLFSKLSHIDVLFHENLKCKESFLRIVAIGNMCTREPRPIMQIRDIKIHTCVIFFINHTSFFPSC